ncbi:hypothetical protein [Gemmobacter sp. 24YEA27]|uniref:hypothetical protein n=1 Tax=Gemmobacter sp. 24YEA27 TaxID=3040672 RepID=UPI0024B3793D|nr:hypothetical protein [Gemmobacter sp. 24YEA27]
MKNTPLVSLFPRERGAITGHVMTEAEIAAMDYRDTFCRAARLDALADFREGRARKESVSLGKGCNVILFPRRAEVEDDLIRSNVIFGLFPDPTPPQGGAPAAVARAA